MMYMHTFMNLIYAVIIIVIGTIGGGIFHEILETLLGDKAVMLLTNSDIVLASNIITNSIILAVLLEILYYLKN